jgi:hypothetical protein
MSFQSPVQLSLQSTISWMMVGMSLSTGLVACGPSKVTQCNALVAEINKGKDLSQKFLSAGKEMEKRGATVKNIEQFRAMVTDTSQTFVTLTGNLDQYIGTVKAVELKDEKLVGYRDRMVSSYTEVSTAVKSFTKSLDKLKTLEATPAGQKLIQESEQEMEVEGKRMSEAGKEETKINDEINAYCGGKA